MEVVETKDLKIDKSLYSDELLPKTGEDKKWGIYNFATVWMGAVHNIMSYMTVAGFFILGLNTKQVIAAVLVSAIIVSIFYVLNGVASAKYGVPFTILVRSVFGIKGAIIPALARGLIAGIVFFGTTSVVSAQAFDVLFERLMPGFMSIGGGATIFGLPIYTAISFAIVWVVTVGLFLGGTKVLDRLGAISSPIIYVFIIGAAVWAISIAGGPSNVINFVPQEANFNIPLFIACVSALTSNWAGPMVNQGDFTQRAKDVKSMAIGLPLGFISSYLLFIVTCVGLIAGTEIAFGESIFNIVDALNRMDSTIAVVVLILALNVGAISFVVFANLMPAGLQLNSLFPRKISVKVGGIITAILGVIILPWKLVETQETLFYFYSFIGSMFGPILGIMLSDFFIKRKRYINVESLYVEDEKDHPEAFNYNNAAMITLVVSFIIAMIGAFFQNVPLLKTINDFAFFAGLIVSFVLYTVIGETKKGEQ